MTDIKNVLNAEYVIISVMGPHAGKSETEIFERKIKEIQNCCKSFWLYRSYAAKPNTVQSLCKVAGEKQMQAYCIFIEPAGGTAQPTKERNVAAEYSQDNKRWVRIPSCIKVTGKIKNAYALVFDEINRLDEEVSLNLWDYSEFERPGKALEIRQGRSTLCAVKTSSEHASEKVSSKIRRIMACARLEDPFAIWLR